MRGIFGLDPGWGIAVGRLVTGIVFAVSGYGKWAAGMGATAGGFGKIGIPAPGAAAPFVATLELVGGLLLCLGLVAGRSACCSRSR